MIQKPNAQGSTANTATTGGNLLRAFVKRLLKCGAFEQLGLALAFALGFRGINRVRTGHWRFARDYDRKPLSKGERIICGTDGRDRVFLAPRFSHSYNSRVDVGAKLMTYLLSGQNLGSLTSPAVPIYIALSTSSLTPAKGDTTLSGETVVAGLARVAGTPQNYVNPSTVDGAASFDIYKQFTLTGGATTVVSSALFDAGASGNMFAEANLSSSASMATNDILQVTWTVNI